MTIQQHTRSENEPDPRLAQLRAWLGRLSRDHGLDPATARPASNDASFRGYFRVDAAAAHAGSLIAMDAPPPMEDCRPFVHAAEVLARSGVSVPRVLEADLAQGFLLLDDFGSTTYLSRLDAAGAPALYADASRALVAMQVASDAAAFPPYARELLLRELRLYPDWYVAKHKGVVLTDAERATLEAAFETILSNVLAQPAVTVHRDYHSRNLMVLPGERNPGILDFQDIRYWERARAAKLPVASDFGEFYRDFEWMGLQRHLKVLGIFARLNYRDGKERYLADLPLVMRYVREVVGRYLAFKPLALLLDRLEGRAPAVVHTF